MNCTFRLKAALIPATIWPGPLAFHALLSLCAGAVIYLLFRQHPAVFIPEWLLMARSPIEFDHAIVAKLTQSLPSFFHMYALMLASHAVYRMPARVHPSLFREYLCLPFLGCCVIGFGLEIVQHPLLKTGLARLSLETEEWAPLLSGAIDYGVRGTFDGFDMLAIAVAALLASVHAGWFNNKFCGASNTETSL